MQVKLIDNRLELPKYATVQSAAFDLHASFFGTISIRPGESRLIHFGIAIDIGSIGATAKLAGLILPRSGLGSRGLVLQNNVGLIDADYQGELKAVFVNRSTVGEVFVINELDRVAQLVIQPIWQVSGFEEVTTFSRSTDRGAGGFGSTGVK